MKLDGHRITHTVDYELSREGVDDLKYLCKLEGLITQARKFGQARAQARAAADFLKKLEDSGTPGGTPQKTLTIERATISVN